MSRLVVIHMQTIVQAPQIITSITLLGKKIGANGAHMSETHESLVKSIVDVFPFRITIQ